MLITTCTKGSFRNLTNDPHTPEPSVVSSGRMFQLERRNIVPKTTLFPHLCRLQLKNWKNYLNHVIEKGNHARTIILFERCLIACAFYEGFWIKVP